MAPKRGPRALWTEKDDIILLDTLLGHLSEKSDNGFKPQAWTAVEQAMEGSEGPKKNVAACRRRYGSLKNDFKDIEKLRGLSGFGWDEDRKMVTAPDAVWDAYLATHKKHLKWRTKPCSLYEKLSKLSAGDTASGDHVFVPGQPADASADATEAAQGVVASPPSRSANARDNNSSSASSTSADESSESEVEATGTQARKRAAVQSPSPLPLRRKKSRMSGPDAIFGVARALESISSAFADSSASTSQADFQPSPVRRATATKLVYADDELSENELIQVTKMFRIHTDIADMYQSIPTKAARARYVRSELKDFLETSE